MVWKWLLGHCDVRPWQASREAGLPACIKHFGGKNCHWSQMSEGLVLVILQCKCGRCAKADINPETRAHPWALAISRRVSLEPQMTSMYKGGIQHGDIVPAAQDWHASKFLKHHNSPVIRSLFSWCSLSSVKQKWYSHRKIGWKITDTLGMNSDLPRLTGD